MKKIKVIIGIIIVLVFAFLYAHVAKPNVIYDKDIDNSQYIATGVFDDKVEQEFVCREKSLDGISAKCQLIGDAAESAIKATVIELESGKAVAETKLAAEDIKNSKFNVFSFKTVEGCKGKEYKVIFESISENVKENHGIGLLYQPTTEKRTNLRINGNETDGTLIMKTITNRFDFETYCVLLFFVIYIVLFVRFLYKLFK